MQRDFPECQEEEIFSFQQKVQKPQLTWRNKRNIRTCLSLKNSCKKSGIYHQNGLHTIHSAPLCWDTFPWRKKPHQVFSDSQGRKVPVSPWRHWQALPRSWPECCGALYLPSSCSLMPPSFSSSTGGRDLVLRAIPVQIWGEEKISVHTGSVMWSGITWVLKGRQSSGCSDGLVQPIPSHCEWHSHHLCPQTTAFNLLPNWSWRAFFCLKKSVFVLWPAGLID